MAKVLFIYTITTGYDKADGSHAQTGFYLPEAAHPYHVLSSAGFSIDFATVDGSSSVVDQGSVEAFKDDAICTEWKGNFIKVGLHTPAITSTHDPSGRRSCVQEAVGSQAARLRRSFLP